MVILNYDYLVLEALSGLYKATIPQVKGYIEERTEISPDLKQIKNSLEKLGKKGLLKCENGGFILICDVEVELRKMYQEWGRWYFPKSS